MKGRGSGLRIKNKFEKYYSEVDEEFEAESVKTEVIEVYPKTIINKVNSPDIPFNYSINPYQGCEHGCAYCYARPTHQFWGYDAGLDFESKIMVKKNAPYLLEKELNKKNHIVKPIMFSGNTDCYQPIEQKFKITRSLLEVCLKYRHPVGIITKNALILRDLDILQEMQKLGLVQVAVSITTLDEELRRKLEPRTASIKKKMATVEQLSAIGVPVNIMMAPIIPGLTDHEILEMGRIMAEKGAKAFNYTVLRLNDEAFPVFCHWLAQNFPNKKDKILGQIAQMHGGKTGNKKFRYRMSGKGVFSKIIRDQIEWVRNQYFSHHMPEKLNIHHFVRQQKPSNNQLKLF